MSKYYTELEKLLGVQTLTDNERTALAYGHRKGREDAQPQKIKDLIADRNEWKQQHENLLSVRQSDLQVVEQLQSQVEQLQADNARLQEEFDELTNLPIKWYVSEREARFVFATTDDRDEFVKYIIGVKAFASTDSSNWLAEHDAKVRREVLEEVYKEVDCGITHVRWALEIISRMAEQPDALRKPA